MLARHLFESAVVTSVLRDLSDSSLIVMYVDKLARPVLSGSRADNGHMECDMFATRDMTVVFVSPDDVGNNQPCQCSRFSIRWICYVRPGTVALPYRSVLWKSAQPAAFHLIAHISWSAFFGNIEFWPMGMTHFIASSKTRQRQCLFPS
jgi:hypothetical protein